MKYWAYRHINGNIALKVFRGDKASIEDAFDSPFVHDVLEPFEAETRELAVDYARQNLSLTDEQKKKLEDSPA